MPLGRSVTWRWLVGLAVPGVLLDDAAGVGGVEAAVRGVLRPLGQRDPRRAEPGLPAGGDLGGEGRGGGGAGLDAHRAIFHGDADSSPAGPGNDSGAADGGP